MNTHFFLNHYYKYIVLGVCGGICLTMLVVYANDVQVNESLATETEQVVTEDSVSDLTIENEVVSTTTSTTDISSESSNETEIPSVPVVDIPPVVSEELKPEPSSQSVTDTISNESYNPATSTIIGTSSTETVEADLYFEEPDFPTSPEECLARGWRELFSNPGECIHAVRDGLFRF